MTQIAHDTLVKQALLRIDHALRVFGRSSKEYCRAVGEWQKAVADCEREALYA